jgi:hypothetical protein
MPHGDFSDLAAVTLLAGGFQQMFYPALQFSDLGPFKAFFSTSAQSTELEMMIRFCGGFLVIIGCMLFTVRWNTINGKLSGLASIGCATNIAYTTFNFFDKGSFILRSNYIYAGVLFLAGLHLMFNANPIIKVDSKKNK